MITITTAHILGRMIVTIMSRKKIAMISSVLHVKFVSVEKERDAKQRRMGENAAAPARPSRQRYCGCSANTEREQ